MSPNATETTVDGVELYEVVPPTDPNIAAAKQASPDLLDLQATPRSLWARELLGRLLGCFVGWLVNWNCKESVGP